MNKKTREKVFNKYGGRCAYCGRELQKGWHVDHLKPVVRKLSYNPDTGRVESTKEYHFPENDKPENYMPACASCNIQKGSSDIEGFRWFIQNTINSMNKRFTQYKFAKRYGLVEETGKTVTFYYETFTL